MKTPAQTLARLLGSLEDLVAQERIALEAEDFTTVHELQLRTSPLIGRIAELASAADRPMRDRLVSVLEQRQREQEKLAARMAEIRSQLGQLDGSRRRLTQIAPAYGRVAPETRQLNAAG